MSASITVKSFFLIDEAKSQVAAGHQLIGGLLYGKEKLNVTKGIAAHRSPALARATEHARTKAEWVRIATEFLQGVEAEIKQSEEAAHAEALEMNRDFDIECNLKAGRPVCEETGRDLREWSGNSIEADHAEALIMDLEREGARRIVIWGIEFIVRPAPLWDNGVKMARRVAAATGASFETAFHAMKATGYIEERAIRKVIEAAHAEALELKEAHELGLYLERAIDDGAARLGGTVIRHKETGLYLARHATNPRNETIHTILGDKYIANPLQADYYGEREQHLVGQHVPEWSGREAVRLGQAVVDALDKAREMAA